MENELEPGNIVLCTVEKIEGTMVFVKIDGTGQQGSVITSEIAPGRIRNLRDYVVPKKKIICKILRIRGKNIDLSLRRVTPKDQKEIKEKLKQEKSYLSILKSVLKEKTDQIIEKIKEQDKVYDFLEQSKTDSKELEKIVGKNYSEKILEILKKQKSKKIILKKEIHLTTIKPNGLTLIKQILEQINNVEIKYISAGKYSLKIESDNPKNAENQLKKILEQIKEQAKKQSVEFEIKGK